MGNFGKVLWIFYIIMGSVKDFESEGFRRLMVDVCYWCLEMEGDIEDESDVVYVGEYYFFVSGFNYEKFGVIFCKFEEYCWFNLLLGLVVILVRGVKLIVYFFFEWFDYFFCFLLFVLIVCFDNLCI